MYCDETLILPLFAKYSNTAAVKAFHSREKFSTAQAPTLK